MDWPNSVGVKDEVQVETQELTGRHAVVDLADGRRFVAHCCIACDGEPGSAVTSGAEPPQARSSATEAARAIVSVVVLIEGALPLVVAGAGTARPGGGAYALLIVRFRAGLRAVAAARHRVRPRSARSLVADGRLQLPCVREATCTSIPSGSSK